MQIKNMSVHDRINVSKFIYVVWSDNIERYLLIWFSQILHAVIDNTLIWKFKDNIDDLVFLEFHHADVIWCLPYANRQIRIIFTFRHKVTYSHYIEFVLKSVAYSVYALQLVLFLYMLNFPWIREKVHRYR